MVLPELAARPLRGGGALFDQHIHDVDAVNFIFGRPDRVSTAAKTLFEKSAYDTCSTNYYYNNSDRPINTQNDWTLSGRTSIRISAPISSAAPLSATDTG